MSSSRKKKNLKTSINLSNLCDRFCSPDDTFSAALGFCFSSFKLRKKASELQKECRQDGKKSSFKCQTGFILHLRINLKPERHHRVFF